MRRITGRRSFLKVGLAALSLPILAACGGAASPTAAPPKPTEPRPEGTRPAAAPTKPAEPAKAAEATKPAAGATTTPAAAAATKPAGAAPAAGPVAAKPGTELKIIQWSHFVPAYDEWFNKKYVLEWGQTNNVKVTVDNINQADHPARTAAEASSKSGHDIFDWFALLYAHVYKDLLVDVDDLANPIGERFGGWIPFAEQIGKVEGKWKTVPDFLVPFTGIYRSDVFKKGGLEKAPDTWDDLINVGAKGKAGGNPVGVSLAQNSDAEMSWRSLMWSYGAAEVKDDGKSSALDSPETRKALQAAKDLYEKAMTNEVLSWDDAANNQYIQSGKGCWIHNPISAYRTIEGQNPELFKNIEDALTPAGPAGRFMSPQFNLIGIWNFSKNVDTAKAFVWDLKVNQWETAHAASKAYDFPMEKDHWKQPMPVIGNDPKLKALQEVDKTARWIGSPGPVTVAAAEVLDAHVITTMFGRFATGQGGLDEVIKEAVGAQKQIYQKRGLA
ncbi:MAG TPA: extracellular solute-binding protein [Chloroflexota bacterium]